jgi:hypothetical protein
MYCLFLDSPDHPPIYRKFKLDFIRYSLTKREVEVWLMISRPLSKEECIKSFFNPLTAEVDTRFWVGTFAFPMIDNTRLTEGERCAVTLDTVSEALSLQARLAYFPESRASLKDKPYYDEVLRRLSNKNQR